MILYKKKESKSKNHPLSRKIAKQISNVTNNLTSTIYSKSKIRRFRIPHCYYELSLVIIYGAIQCYFEIFTAVEMLLVYHFVIHCQDWIHLSKMWISNLRSVFSVHLQFSTSNLTLLENCEVLFFLYRLLLQSMIAITNSKSFS